MKRFFKLFAADTKRLFCGKAVYALLALCLLFTLFVFFFSLVPQEYDGRDMKHSGYGIRSYSGLAELQSLLDGKRAEYDMLVASLNEEIENENLTRYEIRNRQGAIDSVRRTLLTYEYLYDHNISYADFQDFGGVSITGTADKNEIVYYYSLMYIIGIAAVFITMIRAATLIPSEISGGKHKIFFTVPLSRVRFAVYRFLFLFLQTAAFMVIYAVFTALLSAVFFGVNDVLVFATKDYVFGLGFLPAVLLILVSEIFMLFAATALAYSLSLLITNRVIPLLIVLFCGGGPISVLFMIISFITGTDIEPWFITRNINPLFSFIATGNHSVLLSLAVTFAYVVPFAAAALFKFKKQDLR